MTQNLVSFFCTTSAYQELISGMSDFRKALKEQLIREKNPSENTQIMVFRSLYHSPDSEMVIVQTSEYGVKADIRFLHGVRKALWQVYPGRLFAIQSLGPII
jgi:hypothetical protein